MVIFFHLLHQTFFNKWLQFFVCGFQDLTNMVISDRFLCWHQSDIFGTQGQVEKVLLLNCCMLWKIFKLFLWLVFFNPFKGPDWKVTKIRLFQCIQLCQDLFNVNQAESVNDLYTVATNELLCLKNAGTQISMFFTSNE